MKKIQEHLIIHDNTGFEKATSLPFDDTAVTSITERVQSILNSKKLAQSNEVIFKFCSNNLKKKLALLKKLSKNIPLLSYIIIIFIIYHHLYYTYN